MPNPNPGAFYEMEGLSFMSNPFDWESNYAFKDKGEGVEA